MPTPSKRIRSNRGTLEGGVVGLCLIIFGTLAALALVANIGMSMYYKQKLSFAAMQTATFIATNKSANQEEIRDVAATLMAGMGVGIDKVTAEVEHRQIKGRKAVYVKLVAKDLPLLVNANLANLPMHVTLSDAAIAFQQPGSDVYIWQGRSPQLRNFLLPATRMPAGGPQAADLPVIQPW